ncbi:MAG: outer membrane protein assembly factor BamB family protein [Acidiferrobacteraceae bacterium]
MTLRRVFWFLPFVMGIPLLASCARFNASRSHGPVAAVPPGTSGAQADIGPGQWPMYALRADHDAVFGMGATGTGAGWTIALPGAVPAGAGKAWIRRTYVSPTAVRDRVGVPVGVSVVRGVIYVPDDNGHLYAVDAGTGAIRWSFNAHNQIMTTPIVAGHGRSRLVYVGGGNSTFSYSQAVRFGIRNASVIRGTDISGIYALRAATGKEVWVYHTKGEDMPTPLYYRGRIVFGNGDGHIYGLDAHTGTLLWKSFIGSFVSMSSATQYRNLIIMAGTHPNGIYAVNARSGVRAWSTYPRAVFSSSMGDCAPAVSHGIVVTQYEVAAGPGRAASVELALNARNGRILWRKVLGAGRVPPRNKDAVPAVVGDVVYTGSPVTATAYALDLHSGKVLWQTPLKVKMKAAPTIVGRYVFFPVADGRIFVLSRRHGQVWKTERTGHGGFGPQNAVAVGHSLIIGSNFGWLYSIPIAQLTSGIALSPPHY